MRAAILIITPYIIIWLLTRSRRAFRWIFFTALFTIQLFSLIPLLIIGIVILKQPAPANTVLARISNAPKVTADYPLRISWYDPSLGGTNCDSDCSTMASGDNVASWIGGRGGVYAAACPRSDGWHHGQRFELDGVIYECRDTGGWINCYQPGQLDRAIQNAHSRGYLLDVPAIAEQYYCWVDLLNNSSYGYGNLAHDWSMIR